jgi:hypothetical protein
VIPRISLRQALADPALLGGVLDGQSWKPWRTLLIAAMGEDLTQDERPVFKKFTGRDREPGRRVEEFVGIKGRRAGGSYAGGKVVIPYLAGLCQHPSLVRGERGVLLCVAADQRQADVILDYADASFRASPVLSQLIEARTQRELRLNNGIDIEVRAADYRRLRGLTFIAVIADEVAFWSSDYSVNPDDEILNAVRPGLATTGGPLFMISSPYARRGELWRVFQKHYGGAGDPLIMVAKGSSRDFNATLAQSVVDRAMERDPAAASAEYGGEFRRDIEGFVSIEAVTACVSRGVYERAPQRGVIYNAFVDPSGGAGDAMTLAVGHQDHARQAAVVDALREVTPPFSPEQVVEQFSSLLRSYNCDKVVGDRYAGEWPVDMFNRFNICFEQAARPKSDLYVDLLASLNSRRVDLLDNPKLISQLCALERRTARSGRDSVDHPPGGHDDVANAVAGVAAALTTDRGAAYLEFCRRFNGSTDADRDGVEAWRRLRDFAYVSTGGAVRLW